eukprot:gene6-66_t
MAEFRHIKRTHSDPDMPSLVPLPARPSSSYQQRLAEKEFAQFQPEVINGMAKILGTDLPWIREGCGI